MVNAAFSGSETNLPDALPGFERIRRYWDKQDGQYAAKIPPGEYYVTASGEMLTTVLGSCVSACVRDPAFGIGGMNHFMLPMNSSDCSECWGSTLVNAATRYGNYAMEHLINNLLKHGGRRDHLEVKIFGGGRVLAQMTDVGRRNIEFVMEYLRTEGFIVAAKDVGDIFPRKINYYPQTGKVRVKKLRSVHNDTVASREKQYLHDLEHESIGGDVDLFD